MEIMETLMQTEGMVTTRTTTEKEFLGVFFSFVSINKGVQHPRKEIQCRKMENKVNKVNLNGPLSKVYSNLPNYYPLTKEVSEKLVETFLSADQCRTSLFSPRRHQR